MRIIVLKFIILNLFLAFCQVAEGQIMYPGDVTNNGEVNGIDALFLGFAYGESGPPRNDAETEWTPQNITTPWASTFANGLNHAYADCDGDGEVDDEDFDVVGDNFGQMQPSVTPDVFSSGVAGADPELTLTKDPGAASLGETVEFTLSLGDMAIPVSDFYGIAFTINYDPGIFEDDDFDFSFDENTWITTDPDEFEDLILWEEDEASPGEINVAITRINQMPISGAGALGKFSIVVEDIIVGMAEDTTTLIELKRVKMLSNDMSEIAVVPNTFPLLIQETKLSTSVLNTLESNIQIYPNPIKNTFYIRHIHGQISNAFVLDMFGRVIPCTMKRCSSDEMQIRPTHLLPNGIYTITVETDEGWLSRKIFKME